MTTPDHLAALAQPALRGRGRPLGERAREILAEVAARPRPIAALAADLGWEYGVAARLVSRLVDAGHATYGDALPGAGTRPARVVMPAVAEQRAAVTLAALSRGFFGGGA